MPAILSAGAIELVGVESSTHRAAARVLIDEYLRWVAGIAHTSHGLNFDIGAMIESDVGAGSGFDPPSGRFYLLRHARTFVGVGGLKRLAPGIAEVQRMYVQPRARGLGAARILVERLINDARLLGYTRLRLESLKALAAAHNLYRSVGFEDIDPYSHHSMRDYLAPQTSAAYRASAVFMELSLGER
jgi:GNAT superfamily N-acetyltransferase